MICLAAASGGSMALNPPDLFVPNEDRRGDPLSPRVVGCPLICGAVAGGANS